MTNAQAALIAATAGVNWSPEQALKRAEKFKQWLDEQDVLPLHGDTPRSD